MKKIFFIFCILIIGAINAQTKSILIANGIAHIGNDSVIQNSFIGIKDGKIVEVVNAAKENVIGSYDEKIDATGKHLYPGFIALNSTLGLVEIEAVRATDDFKEVGTTLPNIRTQIAYNADSKIIPTIRFNGILLAQITPRGGLISGTSTVVTLTGWNWEDATYKADDGIHINWPRMQIKKNSNENEESSGASEKNKEYNKQVELLKKLFIDAKAYNENDMKEEKNLRFESMKGLFDGTQTLFIHCNNVKEIIEAVNFSKQNSVKKTALVGAYDSWRVTDLLRENNISVVLARTRSLPEHSDDDVDMPYKLPYLLQKAGILFCISSEGDMEAMQTRNLPFDAGITVAYGLTKEQALKAITINAAKILGIDKTTGSIEVGKDANLFISTGDALDMKSNNIEFAFIKGNYINLDNEQKALYEKYKKKYGLK